MPSRNISVTEDIYQLLSKMKLEGESFSEVIRRLAKDRKITEAAGGWAKIRESIPDVIEAINKKTNPTQNRRKPK